MIRILFVVGVILTFGRIIWISALSVIAAVLEWLGCQFLVAMLITVVILVAIGNGWIKVRESVWERMRQSIGASRNEQWV